MRLRHHQEESALKRAVWTAAGGAVAAMAMTGMRTLTTQLGLLPKVPPEEIVEVQAPQLLDRLEPRKRQVAIELTHWAYGAAAGVAFGLLPMRHPRAWRGPAYGVLIWLLFQAGIAPLFGLRVRERKVREHLSLLLDHVLYGLIVSSSRWGPH